MAEAKLLTGRGFVARAAAPGATLAVPVRGAGGDAGGPALDEASDAAVGGAPAA
jgi:hypothetical protein